MAISTTKSKSQTSTRRGLNPSTTTIRELWARSAGVCQYPGCGEVLYRDDVTPWLPINLGEVAHNVGSSASGPRGDESRSAELADHPNNLLMLCRKHHKVADGLLSEYREQTLTLWKTRHETTVLNAAQLTRGEIVFPLVVRASQIGGHDIEITDTDVIRAILDEGLTPAGQPHHVVLNNIAQPDDNDAYWTSQINTIRDELRLCRTQIRRNGTDASIAVFPLAEMPALMALGHAIGDKGKLRIHQFTRHAGSWAFQYPEREPPSFDFEVPTGIDKCGVALVIGLTVPIEVSRVRNVVGPEIPIVNFTSTVTGTEMVYSAETIDGFRRDFRDCLTNIENSAPREAPIYLFPSFTRVTRCSNWLLHHAKGRQSDFDLRRKGSGRIFSQMSNLAAEPNHRQYTDNKRDALRSEQP